MPSTFMRRDDRQNDCRQVRTVVELLPRRKRRKEDYPQCAELWAHRAR
jgi:hypothetical protein